MHHLTDIRAGPPSTGPCSTSYRPSTSAATPRTPRENAAKYARPRPPGRVDGAPLLVGEGDVDELDEDDVLLADPVPDVEDAEDVFVAGGKVSETLGDATLQNCCERLSAAESWLLHWPVMQLMRELVKFVFPQKQSTSVTLLQFASETANWRQFVTQAVEVLRLGKDVDVLDALALAFVVTNVVMTVVNELVPFITISVDVTGMLVVLGLPEEPEGVEDVPDGTGVDGGGVGGVRDAASSTAVAAGMRHRRTRCQRLS